MPCPCRKAGWLGLGKEGMRGGGQRWARWARWAEGEGGREVRRERNVPHPVHSRRQIAIHCRCSPTPHQPLPPSGIKTVSGRQASRPASRATTATTQPSPWISAVLSLEERLGTGAHRPQAAHVGDGLHALRDASAEGEQRATGLLLPLAARNSAPLDSVNLRCGCPGCGDPNLSCPGCRLWLLLPRVAT